MKAEFAAIGSGQVDKVAISGPVDNASWALFGKLAGHDLGSVVQFDGPARLDANVTLSDEGKFSHAEGRIAAGPVRCAGVPLDAAAGHFAFQGVHLLCDEVFLQTGTSSARGTYEWTPPLSTTAFCSPGRRSRRRSRAGLVTGGRIFG